MPSDVQVPPHLRVLAVDVWRFFTELLDLAGRGVRSHGDVARGIQINPDPVLHSLDRRFVDGHRHERELLVQLDLVDLLEWRKVADVQAELEAGDVQLSLRLNYSYCLTGDGQHDVVYRPEPAVACLLSQDLACDGGRQADLLDVFRRLTSGLHCEDRYPLSLRQLGIEVSSVLQLEGQEHLACLLNGGY